MRGDPDYRPRKRRKRMQPWMEPGAFISIMRAKLYAAELRLLVAEAERAQLKREFDREVERNNTILAQVRERAVKAEAVQVDAWQEIGRLKRKLRNRKPVRR